MSDIEYMRQYMLKRYHKRRKEAIEKLGGHCVKCGAAENLELDHIDPSTKSFTIAAHGSVNEKLWQEELKKCQLLCRSCHQGKTLKDRGQNSARETHGTLSSYRYCKCDKCKAAKAKHNKEYKLKRRTAVV